MTVNCICQLDRSKGARSRSNIISGCFQSNSHQTWTGSADGSPCVGEHHPVLGGLRPATELRPPAAALGAAGFQAFRPRGLDPIRSPALGFWILPRASRGLLGTSRSPQLCEPIPYCLSVSLSLYLSLHLSTIYRLTHWFVSLKNPDSVRWVQVLSCLLWTISLAPFHRHVAEDVTQRPPHK